MGMKSLGLLGAAVGAIGLVGSTAKAATVTLYIEASLTSTNGGNWVVFASDSTGDNAGIGTFAIDVTGTNAAITAGGQDVSPDGPSIFTTAFNASTYYAPVGARKIGKTNFNTGFDTLLSDGTVTSGSLVGVDGSQNLVYGATHNATLDTLVYQGVGQVDSTNTNSPYNVTANTDAAGDGAAWGSTSATGNGAAYASALPGTIYGGGQPSTAVDLASGTFTITNGALPATLNVVLHNGGQVQVLNPSWSGPGGAFSASVTPGAAVIVVPEPASLGLIGFAGMGLLSRRRNAKKAN